MAWAISEEYARRWKAVRVVALRIEEACWRLRVWRGVAGGFPVRLFVACKILRGLPRHTREGALAGVGDLDAESRASGLGRGRGHLGSQAAGENTGGGHCIWWCGAGGPEDGLGKATRNAE